MTKKKVSELPAGSVLSGADQAPILQSGVLKRFTMAAIRLLTGNDTLGVQLIARGGTGGTTAQQARTNLLPAQAGQAGKVLGTDATDVAWVTVSAGVTAVDSPHGSCTVSITGTTLHVDIDPGAAVDWTDAQTVTNTVAGTQYVTHICDGTAGAAIVGRANPAGAGGEARLGCLNHAADFAAPGGASIVILAGAALAIEASGMPCLFWAGLDVRTQAGFFGVAMVGQQVSGGALVDSTGGTVGGTLNAVAGTGDDAHINDNFASLSAKVESLRAGLVAFGLFS